MGKGTESGVYGSPLQHSPSPAQLSLKSGFQGMKCSGLECFTSFQQVPTPPQPGRRATQWPLRACPVGPLSITNQVLQASHPTPFCVVLRTAPSFQLQLKTCFPERPPQATSSGLTSTYTHDFQQLHAGFPNLTNTQTSSKGRKYPATPKSISKNPQGLCTPV